MFKYVLSAFICLAFAMPAAAQCGCDCAPTCRTPKKLAFVPTKRCLPQISMKCVTDECGCSRRKLSFDRVEVTGSRLALVDKGPCEGGLLKRMFGNFPKCAGDNGCGCEAAPEPCGCEIAPEPCGCDGGAVDMAPTYAEPMMMYSDPVSAPADCGCNG